jgi:hypothetical protein
VGLERKRCGQALAVQLREHAPQRTGLLELMQCLLWHRRQRNPQASSGLPLRSVCEIPFSAGHQDGYL